MAEVVEVTGVAPSVDTTEVTVRIHTNIYILAQAALSDRSPNQVPIFCLFVLLLFFNPGHMFIAITNTPLSQEGPVDLFVFWSGMWEGGLEILLF